MARVMVDNQNVVAPWRSSYIITAAAAIAGVVWWVLTSLLTRYAVEPLTCSSSATLAACGDSPAIAGSIATIIIAIGMLIFMVNQLRPRPVITVVGASVVLWGLGMYVTGLVWFEAIFWSVLSYIAVYLMMSLVGSIRGLWRSVLTAVICVFVIKLLIAF